MHSRYELPKEIRIKSTDKTKKFIISTEMKFVRNFAPQSK